MISTFMKIVMMLSTNWPELSTERAIPKRSNPVNTLYGVQNAVEGFLYGGEVV